MGALLCESSEDEQALSEAETLWSHFERGVKIRFPFNNNLEEN